MSEEISKDDIGLYYQNKRKKHKIKLAILSITILLVSLVLLVKYCIIHKKHYIDYTENADLNYSVNLIENEFYKEDSLEEGTDIIASLIKDIEIDFKYNLKFSENVRYKYNYKILAEIELKQKTKTNEIYESEQEILGKTDLEGNSKEIEIVEKVLLDYNEYNNLINKLIEQYRLDNTMSELSLGLYVDIINMDTEEKINTQDNVMSLSIPLTTKTAEITKNENVKDEQKQIVINLNNTENSEYYLISSIIISIIGLSIFGMLLKYNLDTRSAEKMYDAELKKILFDYKSYIQKIDTKIDYKNYKIIKIETFRDLLGMREDIKSPILMKTEEENRRTIFMMMHDKILFVYILGANEIRSRLIKESKEKKLKKRE